MSAKMKQKTKEVSVERQTFYGTLVCLQSIGFWLPSTIKKSYQKVLYRFLSIFACISIVVQFVFVLVDIVDETIDFAKLLEVWYLLAIWLFTISKGLNILIKRNLLYDYLQNSVLAKRWTIFRDANEKSFVKKSKKSESFIFKVWGGSIVLNGIFFVLNPIVGGNPDNRLMWECYSPCDVQVSTCFWACYMYQVYNYWITSVINIAYDCLIYSVIERLCSYVKIFQHRLKLLPELVKTGALPTVQSELDYLKQCITDHQNISIMANQLHVIFNVTIFVHFFLNFTVLCTNVFSLTKLVLFSGEFCSVTIHFLCVLLQNLLYSWYGYKFEEFTKDISYTIFGMDWTVLNKNTIKLLRFTMLFSSRPIPLFNNFIVHLSPEMFLKVIKLSYSTFNMIKANN